jgi:hypothetical protein
MAGKIHGMFMFKKEKIKTAAFKKSIYFNIINGLILALNSFLVNQL